MPSATRLPPNPNLTGKPSRALGKYTQCVHHYSGLFSTIYLCPPEPDSKQLLAIKAVSPSSEAPPHNSKREARILAALSHANIVQLLDTQEVFSPRTLLLVFPFQPFTLEDLLTSQNIIPNNIIQDIFYGLSFIHGKGTIHRDVKPTNILLSSLSGPALLCDFGIAWSPTDPASEPREAKITDIGTTSYRAPELLFGCRFYSEAVDLWAAGCVMAEILVHNAHPRGKEGWTLFDAGELGSELALVRSIFETLGTPNERSWPESKDLPDWGKMTFLDFPAKVWEDILPGVDQDEAELVKDLVRYESKDRERAKQVSGLHAVMLLSPMSDPQDLMTLFLGPAICFV